MANNLYARYVPSKTVKAAALPSDGQDLAPTVTKKRKRDTPIISAEKNDSKELNDSFTGEDQQRISLRNDNTEAVIPQREKTDRALKNVSSSLGKKEKKSLDTTANQSEHENSDSHLEKHSSVIQKFKKAVNRPRPESDVNGKVIAEDREEKHLRDLVPIPIPQKTKSDSKQDYSTLPAWLSAPEIIDQNANSTFEELGVENKIIDALASRNVRTPLPVQCAALKLLTPGKTQHLGDLCLAAATGSGKTRSYVLPVVHALKNRAMTRLRAVIVVPTRELVTQVYDVVKNCTSSTGIAVGTAVGSTAFQIEREKLVQRTLKFDAEEYHRRKTELEQVSSNYETSDSIRMMQDDFREKMDDFLDSLPLHIPQYSSKVDILICTPGRLVEYLKYPRGLSLKDLEWLILDEADRLLDQSFQDFVDIIHGSISGGEPKSIMEIRSQTQLSLLQQRLAQRRLRKVVLSATMTRDIEKLGPLKLWNAKLLVAADSNVENVNEAQSDNSQNHLSLSLPKELREHVLPTGDGLEKPLYLLRLISHLLDGQDTPSQALRTKGTTNGSSTPHPVSSIRRASSSYDSSSSLSNSEDENLSESMSSDSDDSSLGSSSSKSSKFEADDTEEASGPEEQNPAKGRSFLIFTTSTESAGRLRHLLCHLSPSWISQMHLVTKSNSASQFQHVTRAIKQASSSTPSSGSDLVLIISTDRAARGLDLQGLDYVINYDVPHDLTGYVHRVGRTARAGNAGQAWTLVTDREARWFWNEIARSQRISRPAAQTVTRRRLELPKGEEGDWLRKKYEDGLADLKREVQESSRRK